MYKYFAYIAFIFVCIFCIVSILNIFGIIKNKKLHRIDDFLVKSSDLIGRYHILILLLLFAIFLSSRLIRLNIIPAGIHLDELGMAYDAKCLVEYGTDRHGIRYPFYLQAYGGGQSALYAYLASICIRCFGYFIQTIRYPAVFCGALCFIASYFLIKEMTESEKWAILGPIFVMITPYFMTSERWALDCNLFLSLMTVAFYFYLKAINSEKTKYYVFAGIAFGVTLYTYVISYLVLPVFLFISILYLIYVKKFKFKKIIYLSIPLALLAFPLILMQLINMGLCPEFSFLFSDFKKLLWNRSGEISFANIPTNILHIKVLLLGGEWLTYNSLYEYGPLYLFSIPLFIYGLFISVMDTYYSIKNKQFNVSTLIVFFLFVAYLIFIMLAGINMYKGNEIFLAFILLMIIAIKHIGEQSKLFVPVILFFFAIGFLSFSIFYFKDQNNEYGMHPLFISTELGDLIAYEESVYNPDRKKVYIERAYEHQTGSDLLIGLYGNVEPKDWTQDGVIQGHFEQQLSDNIDPDEDAIYIIGHNWDFIISYMVSEWGFQADNTYPSYTILYK